MLQALSVSVAWQVQLVDSGMDHMQLLAARETMQPHYTNLARFSSGAASR